jgi:PAS domain-containing protein
MTKLEEFCKFSSILSKINKLADEALELSDARRLQERTQSDEEVQLSESRRLTERDQSEEALDVTEAALDISEKRRLTERDHSDQAFELEKKQRITEQNQSEEALTLSKKQNSLKISKEIDKLNRQIIKILESTHETCLFFYDYQLIYVNTQAQNLYWPKENIIGKTLSELLPKDISEVFLQAYRNDKTPLPLIRSESNNFRANKCFEFFFYPSEFGFLICFNDITRTQQIEKELIRIEALNTSKK